MIASTSGIDSATTSPARSPRLYETHDEDDHQRLEQRAGEAGDGGPHHLGLVGHMDEIDADGEMLLEQGGDRSVSSPKGEVVAAGSHRDADADRRLLPFTSNILVGGSIVTPLIVAISVRL